MKTKQQRNRSMRIAAILLILVMITTCAFSGTLAKYTTAAYAASQKVRVAAWDIEIAFEDPTDPGSWQKLANVTPAELALLSLVKVTHNEDPAQEDDNGSVADTWTFTDTSIDDTDKYGIVEQTTGTANGNLVIAPGMGGYKNIYLRNNSEVPAIVTIDMGSATVNAKLDRVKLAITDTEISTLNGFTGWNGDLATGIPAGTSSDVILDPLSGSSYTTVGIAWQWEFSADDKPYKDGTTDSDFDSDSDADTALGLAAAAWTSTPAAPDGAIVAALEGAKIVVSQVD